MKLNIVPFSSCTEWFAQAFRLFKQRPMFFIGLQSLFFLAAFVASMFGQMGALLHGPVYILFLLSFMLAAHNIRTGNIEITTGALFKKQFETPFINVQLLIVLGALYTLTLFLLSWLSAYSIYAFLTTQDMAVWQELQTRTLTETNNIALTDEQMKSIWAVIFFFIGRTLVIASITQALFLFAPALIYWGKLNPVKAIFFNAVAIFKNIGPMIGYFILSLLLVLCCSVLGAGGAILAMWILGANLIGNGIAFFAFYFCIASALSIINISIYVAFKAQFYHPSVEAN